MYLAIKKASIIPSCGFLALLLFFLAILLLSFAFLFLSVGFQVLQVPPWSCLWIGHLLLFASRLVLKYKQKLYKFSKSAVNSFSLASTDGREKSNFFGLPVNFIICNHFID